MESAEYDRMFRLEERLWWYRALREHVLWWVARLSRGQKLRILDAGCGTGGMTVLLQQYGNVEAIDASPQAVAYCQQRGLAQVHCVDLTSWEPPAETYDVIVSLDVLCHTSIADDSLVVRKFYHALARGGALILNLPAFECVRREHDTVVATRRRYTRPHVRRLLHEAGFRVIHATYRLPWLFMIAFIKRYVERLFPPADGACRSDLKQPPEWLNRLLLMLARAENVVLRVGIRLPLGSSLFLVACKPAANKQEREPK